MSLAQMDFFCVWQNCQNDTNSNDTNLMDLNMGLFSDLATVIRVYTLYAYVHATC